MCSNLPVDLEGESPLHRAVRNDKPEQVAHLLKIVYDPFDGVQDGILDILWDECLFDPLAASIRGETPLHLVKSVEILKIFMNRMVNFNRWDIVITEQKFPRSPDLNF